MTSLMVELELIPLSFLGNKSDYAITEVSYAQYTVIDNRGIDGTDTLTGIETLRFLDQDVDITPDGQILLGLVLMTHYLEIVGMI